MNATYTLIINDKSILYQKVNDLISSVFEIPTIHAKYGSLDSLKENVKSASKLTSEFCDIQQETLKRANPPEDTETKKRLAAEKAFYTKMKKRVIDLSIYCSTMNTKESVYTQLYNFILALEGKALLHGFQYTKKLFKEKPRSNAEKMSILKYT